METTTGKQIVPKLVCTMAIGGVTIWTLYKILLHWRRKVQVYKRQKNIVVIETAEDWNKFFDNFIVDKDVKVIGFDCEWVFEGHRRHPVSLLQIATQHGDCALIRILNFYPNIPESLKNVLANRRILKVGVAAKDDGQKLLHDFGLEVYGCVDLRFLLNRIRGLYKCKTRGLQGLSQGVLGIKMKKDVKIRCGNWEAKKLSPQQIEYAADDAIIAVDIFTHLILAKMNGKKPNLKDVSDTGLYITETGFWEIAKSMCQGILDVGFKWRSMPLDVTQGTGDLIDDCVAETHTQKERQNLDPKSVQPVVKNPRAYVTRKRPLYYNCSLLAPDGEMLCTCDIRKAEWYIMKGLADKVSDDPLTVKLRFEPSGRPNDEFNYYLQYKENVCVVCGKDDSYIRKLVVPKEYRKYFPPSLKNHSSHDVLLMCISCHMISTQYDNALRNQLANECSAPINSSARSTQDHDLQKIKSSAKALILNKDKIPEKRVLELEETVKNFYGVTELTDDILKTAMDLDIRVYNQDYSPHGKKVVKYMVKHGGLYEFERRWRQHFLDTMNPKFMPDLWSVEHRNEHYFNPEETNNVADLEEEVDNSNEYNNLSNLKDADSQRTVWIVGSSLVYWAEQRSRYKNNPNLGLDELGVEIKWCGIRGARWEILVPELNNKIQELPPPEVVIIHLGSNDITSIDTNELIKNMKNGFQQIQEMFPETSFMFSELVSRRKWRGIPVQEGERRRKLVNQKMSDYVLKLGGFVIPHSNITNDVLELYREDGVHLSALGDDILLEDFTDALKDFFVVSFDGM